MKFNSQICTTREQSERLLALGLKAETADISYNTLKEMAHSLPYTEVVLDMERSGGSIWIQFYVPAWSLHRLIELCAIPEVPLIEVKFQNTYDEIISLIEEAIKLDAFNKEYLEE